ncbi:phosphoribosylamine--glycine ligase isoform X2 [Syzygium oleosum]|uniref:phosphoribosylamine--glycine ligase isoform X2 n=1 Tax=Syzygium oleosum TaxID=219896 RepID=UPI0024BAEE3E|nr:phosphoribosylamine--glycine ligase isoform X2 [Syzygium oleosum]
MASSTASTLSASLKLNSYLCRSSRPCFSNYKTCCCSSGWWYSGHVNPRISWSSSRHLKSARNVPSFGNSRFVFKCAGPASDPSVSIDSSQNDSASDGLANDLVKAGIPTFGPSSEAADLEGSKDFMKNLCDKYGIPTAKYKTFTDPSSAKLYIEEQGAPIVVKADGLAAGKGVIVAMTVEEAYEAVDSMLVEGVFGSAGCKVIIEEYLEGEEASFFALVDGENAIALESAQDHKRVGDGDTGPNTGGMGAYSPAPILTQELQSLVMQSIILPTVQGMAAEGCKFVGVLYAGLMIEKKSGMPKLIEYNVRFGDPECQVLMVRLESDLVQVLLSACRGELSRVTLDWSPGSAMVVVMASNGYPGTYEKGSVIQNLEEAELVAPSVKIFHAGTAFDSDGNFVATGGRVLGVTAKGRNLEEAHERAYQAVEAINWPGGFYRHDIGWRALPKKQFAKQN